MRGIFYRDNFIYALRVIQSAQNISRRIQVQPEALRHYARYSGQIWMRIFSHRHVTRKPTETRKNLEKEFLQTSVFFVRSRRILYEMCWISRTVVRMATSTSASKMPNFQAISTASKRV